MNTRRAIHDSPYAPFDVRCDGVLFNGPAADVEAVCALLGRYAGAVRDAAAGRLAPLFHPRAVIFSALAREPMAMSPADLIQVFENHIPDAAEDMTFEIVSIDIDGDMAIARTIGRNVHSFHYRGMFTCVRHEGVWVIGAEATMGELRGD